MRKALLFLILPLSTTACSSMDCGVHRANFDRETKHSENLAFVSFARDENDADPYAVNFNRDRDRRGYAIQAPIASFSEKSHAHFTVSRTKEYRWFSGMQFSWAF